MKGTIKVTITAVFTCNFPSDEYPDCNTLEEVAAYQKELYDNGEDDILYLIANTDMELSVVPGKVIADA